MFEPMTRIHGRFLSGLLLLLALLAPAQVQARDTGSAGPLVLAAASLREALTEAAHVWALAQSRAEPVLSFAGSSALARQILAGAPADIFISADEAWMTAVADKRLIRPETRQSFLGNRLVLIAPEASRAHISIAPGFPLAQLLGKGRLAMADPKAVPAGRYGAAALRALGVWNAVEPKVARAENVRAALALVGRGEAPFGIVYATDAQASDRVRVIGTFPESSHPPISYPIAILQGSTHADAESLRRFLTSARGQAIFARHGFSTGPAVAH